MSSRALTILIAALSMAADAGVTIAGLLPPLWGLVVGAAVAGIFAMVRTLHNVVEGVSLKTYLTSPSAWAAALVILASILSAVSGVVPITYATGIAAFAAIVLRFARVLQTTLQPPSGVLLTATPGGLGTSTIPSSAQQTSAVALAATGPSGVSGPSGLPVLSVISTSTEEIHKV
jgi:hypothetical protein